MEEQHTSGIIDSPALKQKKTLSRFWHVFTAVVYLPLVIVALVCVISFALFDRSFTKNAWPYNTDVGSALGKCVLFASTKDDFITLSSGALGASCAFNTWGEVVVLLIGVVLFVESLAKAAIGMKALNILIFVEFAVLLLVGLLALVIASLFSAGLKTTCGTYRNFAEQFTSDVPNDCSLYFFPKDENGDGTVYFYKSIHTAEITAWIVVCILAVLGARHLVLMCLFVVMRKRRSEDVPYDTLHFDDKEESMKSMHGNTD